MQVKLYGRSHVNSVAHDHTSHKTKEKASKDRSEERVSAHLTGVCMEA